MASQGRAVDPVVKDQEIETRLRKEPFTFEFFQAMRLLERAMPNRQPVGGFGQPSNEVARIGTHSSLAFPASEIQSLRWDAGKQPFLEVNFMGLTGLQGPLPVWFTATILERIRAGDFTLNDFLNIFNHRSISLFYRAWQKYRFEVAYERGERDKFFLDLLALIGLGTQGLPSRQEIVDEALIYYSGLLARHQRSALGLEQLLGDYFEVPVQIEQLVGAWYDLDADSLCCLDGSESPAQELGKGAVVGDQTWDQHSRVRIKLGPLSLERYQDFLPCGSAYKPLQALVCFYSNEELEFEIQLILDRDEVPPCKLDEESATAPQLGWLTWVKSGVMGRNPGDTILPL
jgi:type VI secretion system protein ImpH